MRLPFKGLYIFTQDFGSNPDNYKQFGLLGHDGLDFACPTRTEILAPHTGTIIEALYDEPGYGWYVKIENDVEGSVIAHLESIDVQVGFKLNEGDHIGWSDNTGNSTGPHCHWGYYRLPRNRANGYAGYIDQKPYLLQAGIHLVLGQLPVINTTASAMVSGTLNTYGLDITVTATLQEVLTTWYNVAHGKYKTVEDYNVLQTKFDAVKNQLEDTQKADANVSVDLNHYHALQALGYTTVDDVTQALKTKDDVILSLQTENAQIRNRNGVLAGEIQKMETESNKSAELGQKSLEVNANFSDGFRKLIEIIEIKDRPSWSKIFDQVLFYKDMYNKFMDHLDAEQQKTVAQTIKQAVTVDNLKKVSGSDMVMQLFNLIPKKKEVN